MAAKALFRRLASNPETKVFHVIAEVTSETFWSDVGYASTLTPEQVRKGRQRIKAAAFLNVFRFVAILLVKTGGKDAALKSFLGEIRPALVAEEIAFESFAEFALSCGESELVVKWAAMAAKEASEYPITDDPSWDVTSPRLMTAASIMLPHHQPPSLVVNISENSVDVTSEQESFMAIIGKWFSGALSFHHGYSLRNFLPADDFLIHLWSARCHMESFEGCLGPNFCAWKAFIRAMRETDTLPTERDVVVSLTNPWLHQLHKLEETSRSFVVIVRLDAVKLAARVPPRPLPMNKWRPAFLTIICTPDAGVDEMAALVTHLAPIDKLYSTVWLQHWQGEDSALDELVTKLAAADLQTMSSCVKPSWESTSAEEIDDWVYWREEHSQGEQVVQLFLPNTVQWIVYTGQEMDQITQLLPFEQPLWLCIEPGEMDILPNTPLLEAVRDFFSGNLELRFGLAFNYFLPVDDYLLILSSAKCRLHVFEGCLGQNTEAWQVLADAVRRAKEQNITPNLQISLSEPRVHQFDKFEFNLEVITARLKSGLRCPCPLPLLSNSSRPKLVLVCEFSVTAEDAAALIEDLAPEGKCYDWLGIVRWSGPESDLDDLLQTLAIAGVRTAGEGAPRWQTKLKPSLGCSCWFCKYTMLPDGVSCVRIVIPRTDDHE